MSDEDKSTTKVNEALVRSAADPIAYAIVRVLAERGSASGKEIAAAISKPRSTVGDQLRRLQAGGLIESVGEETRRGTVERFYRVADSARLVEDDEVSQLSAAERRRIVLRILQTVVADASVALSTNAIEHRHDWCLSSARVIVDAEGWTELAAIHRRALEEVERVRDESAERMEKTGEECLRALSSVLLLELPEPE